MNTQENLFGLENEIKDDSSFNIGVWKLALIIIMFDIVFIIIKIKYIELLHKIFSLIYKLFTK